MKGIIEEINWELPSVIQDSFFENLVLTKKSDNQNLT